MHHGTSHGLKTLPKFYRYQEGEVRPVDVNSINFSPFRGDLFLVISLISDTSPKEITFLFYRFCFHFIF